MSTLTGLIGSQPVPTSWPSRSSPTWLAPANAALSVTSTLSDLINVSGSSGYLTACEGVVQSAITGTMRVKITVDGTVVKDMTGSISGDDIVIVVWPPVCNHLPRNTVPYQNGSVAPSFPLRFESSLRVQCQITSGQSLGTMLAQYVLT